MGRAQRRGLEGTDGTLSETAARAIHDPSALGVGGVEMGQAGEHGVIFEALSDPKTPDADLPADLRTVLRAEARRLGLDPARGLHLEDYDPVLSALGSPSDCWLVSDSDGEAVQIVQDPATRALAALTIAAAAPSPLFLSLIVRHARRRAKDRWTSRTNGQRVEDVKDAARALLSRVLLRLVPESAVARLATGERLEGPQSLFFRLVLRARCLRHPRAPGAQWCLLIDAPSQSAHGLLEDAIREESLQVGFAASQGLLRRLFGTEARAA